MTIMFTGGSGCGKSFFAEQCVQKMKVDNCSYFYVATMQVWDDESRVRVARHQAQRMGHGYTTLEIPKNFSSDCIAENSIVLFEDLPNLVANEMFDHGSVARILPELIRLQKKCKHLFIVTNDVFSDGVVYDRETTMYQKELATLNREVASLADVVCELVYGIPIVLKGGLSC